MQFRIGESQRAPARANVDRRIHKRSSDIPEISQEASRCILFHIGIEVELAQLIFAVFEFAHYELAVAG